MQIDFGAADTYPGFCMGTTCMEFLISKFVSGIQRAFIGRNPARDAFSRPKRGAGKSFVLAGVALALTLWWNRLGAVRPMLLK
jgi:hypothetical protein